MRGNAKKSTAELVQEPPNRTPNSSKIVSVLYNKISRTLYVGIVVQLKGWVERKVTSLADADSSCKVFLT